MPYIVVDNFKGGLDTRRHSLSSNPGTLSTLINAHITRGGEIEKRKALYTYAQGAGIYGIEATEDGIVAFKSTHNANSGCIDVYQECMTNGQVSGCEPGSSWNINGFYYVDQNAQYISAPLATHQFVGPYQNNAFATVCPIPPAGVTYQYIDHPEGSALEEIMYSTVYGGSTFVIAKFANGDQIPYFNGQPIKDFTSGYTSSSMGSIANFAEHLKSIIQDQINESQVLFNKNEEWTDPMKDYLVSRLGNEIYITGKGTNDFSVKAYADSPLTATVVTVVKPQEPLSAINSRLTFNIIGGVDGKASINFYFRYINAASLPTITGIYVKGTNTTTPDGVEILSLGTPLSYNSIPPPNYWTAHNEGQLLAWTLKSAINANSAVNKLNSEYYYDGKNWSGPDPAGMSVVTKSDEGASFNNEYMHVEFSADPSAVSGINEFINASTIVASPYNPTRFIATVASTGANPGKFGGGSDNVIHSLKVDDVTELISAPIGWSQSNEVTMGDVIDAINSNTSSGLNHGYTANANFGGVSIESPPAIGYLNNGKKITIGATGSMAIGALTRFGGGRASTALVRKQVKVTLGGTFQAGKSAWILVTDPERPSIPYKFGATRVSGLGASVNVAENGGFRMAFTYKYKAYVAIGSTIYFSALNDATKWDVYDTGTGFIDLSSSFGCRDVVTGMGVYQGYVAFFTERNCQLWNLDPDPSLNAQIQIIDNTGCISNGTIISVGAIDLFYLSYNGVRSLRARQSTDAAYSEDVGSPIDEKFIELLRTLNETQKAAAKAIIEPNDGRYWICAGSKVYVLSTFSSSSINAWSEYDFGFGVDDIIVFKNRVYVRSGNVIYTYGGPDNTLFDGSQVVVEMPYLSANKPGTYKELKGIDITCAGEWTIEAGMDYSNPEARDILAFVSAPTFSEGRIPATGYGTHVGLKMTSSFNGYAKISNVLAHYDEQNSKHEAGT